MLRLKPLSSLPRRWQFRSSLPGEYFFGIARSRHRKIYEKTLGDLLRETAILKIDLDTSREYAAVRDELSRVGKPIPANDLWIAALCRQHSLELLSRDRHFDIVPRLKRRSW
jgi:tRNA(fMet)-specific endonuclease VapC